MIRLFFSALALLALTLPARADIDIQQVTSPGGIKAWLVEDHSIPFTALELRFRGGASLDAAGKRGAINLMVALLEEGAGEMDARIYAERSEELATSFRFSASDDAVAVSAKFLSENRAEALEHLRLALVEPRFDEDAVERVRQQILSGLRQDQSDPRSLATKAFDRAVFGDHPYGSQLDGTLESVSALGRDDLTAAHRAVLARDRLYVSAVGDITAEELATILDSLLSELPETGATMPPAAKPDFPGGVQVVEFDTPQSVVLFGQPGLDMSDPDFFAAYVLNHILGGGSFESRLMQEVREKRGLTYGIYTYLADRDLADYWAGSVSSGNDVVGEAIETIRAEWERARLGVTEAELQDAKTYMTGEYPLRFDGNGPIANILVGLQMMGLTPDYVTERNSRIEAVTMEDITRVAAQLMDPSRLSFFVVGKPEGLDPS